MSRKSQIDKSTEKPSVKMVPEEIAKSENVKDSLSSIREDYPDKLTALIDRLISKEIGLCAEKVGLDHEELQVWVTLQTNAPAKSILHALRTARQYGLDLLQEEVLVTKYDEGWQVSISVDGWMKLINQHPAFSGLTFTQSTEEKEGLPLWMECTIHRSDRIIPTTVREYLTEVRNDSEIWQKMPRRMMRHRVLQQCARLTLSIQLPELKNKKLSYSLLNHEMSTPETLFKKIPEHHIEVGCRQLKEKLQKGIIR
jgi:ribosomal protein L21E